MYQSEAMWLAFNGNVDSERGVTYPFAVKVSTGKISAITGKSWESGLRTKDYCVIPEQKWIDGYVVEDGTVRQFVAAPMGSGVSIEHQVTGKDEHGGIQIEVFPMKASVFEARFPKRDFSILRGAPRSGGMLFTKSLGASPPPSGIDSWFGATNGASNIGEISEQIGASYNSINDGVKSVNLSCDIQVQGMSMAAGGRMKQQIFADKFGLDVWDTSNSSRCFVHLTNSMVWRAITGHNPPETPMTTSEYAANGMPWYDYYQEQSSVQASAPLQAIQSIGQLKPEMLPENQSVEIPLSKVAVLSGKPTPNKVREGSW